MGEMSRREAVAGVLVASILGLLVVALTGTFPRARLLSGVRGAGSTTPMTDRSDLEREENSRQSPPGVSPEEDVLPGTPAPAPLKESTEKAADLEDVLLLYESTYTSREEINFCKVAEYYGLICRRLAVDVTDLTDSLLRDSKGDYYRLVGVSADTLLDRPNSLSSGEVALLRSAIREGGVSLFVSKIADRHLDIGPLRSLTAGAVLGIRSPQEDINRDWIVSSRAPEVTREFTGQEISYAGSAPGDFELVLSDSGSASPLITGKDDRGATYPIFVRYQVGAGSVFIDAGEAAESLEERPFREMYYGHHGFSKIIPLMMAMRFALAEEVWHSKWDFGNLTIDDPALIEPYENLNFGELLQEMKDHNFSTTIAFEPHNWTVTEPGVAALFLENPDRYSLVQHGNNADGYEFYFYGGEGESQSLSLPPRPLDAQHADIVEGLARMGRHRIRTGIPFDRIMIFPWGISPEPTLVLLKRYGFLATVNGQDVPLGESRPTEWDYGMYQANLEYGNFPSIPRRHPGEYQPFRPDILPFIFDLFLDKPALFYSHAYAGELFDEGAESFSPVADQINVLAGEVEWRSLGFIVRHLYLERTNDDGSVDVKFYGNNVIVANELTHDRTFHLYKEETLNVPIDSLSINGAEFRYVAEDGTLRVDVSVPAHYSIELVIEYGDW